MSRWTEGLDSKPSIQNCRTQTSSEGEATVPDQDLEVTSCEISFSNRPNPDWSEFCMVGTYSLNARFGKHYGRKDSQAIMPDQM